MRVKIREAIASKIVINQRKKPCAWIVCASYEAIDVQFPTGSEVTYNPYVSVHWECDEQVIDNSEHDVLISCASQIFIA